MKKLLFILIVGFFIGCMPPSKEFIPEIEIFYKIDFSGYTDKGFLFTPHIYNGDYESIGLITLLYYPEAKMVKETVYYERMPNETTQKEISKWVVGDYNTEQLLETIYKKCADMGGDAFIDFRLTNDTMLHNVGTPNEVLINGIKIEGYAIKRLGAFK